MKKPVLTLLMLLVLLPLMAQQQPVRIVNQEVRPVDKVKIPSCCHVSVVTDTVDCVRVEVYADSPSAMPRNMFYYADGTLTVLDSAVSYGITVGSSNRHVVVEYVSTPTTDGQGLSHPIMPIEPVRSYGFDDRMFYKVVLALSNWGEGVFQGLRGIPSGYGDGAYSLAYRPGSVGVEINYAFAIREHWSLGVGIGLEYNNYYFESPYVYYYPTEEGRHGFRVRNVTDRGGWQSHLSQINLAFPIQFNLYSRPSHTGFLCQMELLPGLTVPTNVWQSYTSTENGIYTTTETCVGVLDAPLLCCNLRLSLNWGMLGLFWENSLIPILRHMDIGGGKAISLYPMRFGFSLDLSRMSRN